MIDTYLYYTNILGERVELVNCQNARGINCPTLFDKLESRSFTVGPPSHNIHMPQSLSNSELFWYSFAKKNEDKHSSVRWGY